MQGDKIMAVPNYNGNGTYHWFFGKDVECEASKDKRCAFCDYAFTANHNQDLLIGKLMQQLEASFPATEQITALKNVIKDIIYNQFGEIREQLFSNHYQTLPVGSASTK